MSVEAPLLPAGQQPPSKMSPPTSPPPTSSLTISTLAILRMGVGIGVLIIPRQLSPFFGVPLASQGNVIARLFAARDFMLGGLLWTAKLSGVDGDSNRELKRALWAGIITDGIDVGSCVVGLLEGSLQKRAIVGVGAGAVFLLGMGLVGLRSV